MNGEGRFLRGATKSGNMQSDAFASHSHHVTLSGGEHSHGKHKVATYGTGGDTDGDPNGARDGEIAISGGAHEHTGDTDSVGDTETRPINMSVVWIIKIK